MKKRLSGDLEVLEKIKNSVTPLYHLLCIWSSTAWVCARHKCHSATDYNEVVGILWSALTRGVKRAIKVDFFFFACCATLHSLTRWLWESSTGRQWKEDFSIEVTCFSHVLTQLALADVCGASGSFHKHSIFTDFLRDKEMTPWAEDVVFCTIWVEPLVIDGEFRTWPGLEFLNCSRS